MGVAIFVILFTASGLACHQLAARWGMKAVLWGILGFCFGPFAIPFVLIFRPTTMIESGSHNETSDDQSKDI